MDIYVRGKNFKVSDALKEWVEKKIGKLEKYFDDTEDVGEAQVIMIVHNERHRAEVTISLNGIVLRGEEETDDMYATIDQVLNKIERQIKKYKTKINRKLRKESIKDFVPSRFVYDSEEDEPEIVKTKRFAMKPMPVEEAVMQMDLIGHNFYVFRNADTGEVNVVYQRKDGNYGLIEPEF